MRKKDLGLRILGFSLIVLFSIGLSWAQTPPTLLVVVRADDDSLWKMTCDDVTCSPFTSFPGMFRTQPTVTWNEKAHEWVVLGTAADNSIWTATFDKDGNFNNDWQSVPGRTPSPAGASGAFYGPTVYNPLQIAHLKWYQVNQTAQFSVTVPPGGIVFDGAHIWVANPLNNSVTMLRASDGVIVGTFAVGTNPHSIAFDGANNWVVNGGSDNVTKLRGSDGANLGTFAAGTDADDIAFDGANIWVSNSGSNNVTKLRASDGFNLGTFAVGSFPVGVAFDGVNIWVTNLGSNSLSKL